MFEVIKEFIDKSLQLDEHKLLHDVLEDETLQAQIIDLNQNQLYEQGIQSDGTPTGEYAPITISYYKPLAASRGRDGRSDHITGKDTGETYRSFNVINREEDFLINAEDRNKFFDRIDEGLGLTNESIQHILPEIKDSFIEKIREQIGI